MNNTNQSWAYSLAKRFAPFIIFHTEDKYRPCSVDWLLNKCTIQKSDGTKFLLKKKRDLIDHNHRTTNLFLNGVQDRIGDLTQAKIYVHLRNTPRMECKDTMLYDIQYWIFYPFNGNIAGGRIGEHEGDWEHLTIRLAHIFTAPKVVAVFFSAHGKGEWIAPNYDLHFPNKNEAYLQDGERLYAFAAKHSHAFFESEGAFNRWVVLNDYTDQGEKWDTQNQLEIISDSFTSQQLHFQKNNVVPDFSFKPTIRISQCNLWWMCFKGRWGKDKHSPVGPLIKKVWSRSVIENEIPWIDKHKIDHIEMV